MSDVLGIRDDTGYGRDDTGYSANGDPVMRPPDLKKIQRALRYNEGKLRYDLLPVEWEEELARVLTRGALKYRDENWRLSANTEESDKFRRGCIAALRRHFAEWRRGRHVDVESGLLHLAQLCWNALVLMTYDMEEKKIQQDPNYKLYVDGVPVQEPKT